MKPAAAVSIAGFYALYFASVGVILPFLPAYLTTLGLNATEVGTLLALTPALALVAPSIWGHLADRSGRPDRVLRMLAAGAALGFAPLLWLHSYAALAASIAAYAFFASSISAMVDGIALHRVQVQGGSFARLRLWGSLGFVVSASAFGRMAATPDRITVAVPLLLMCGYALWSWTVRVQVPPHRSEASLGGLSLLRQRDLALMLVAAALHWIACAPFHGMFAIHVQALHLPMWVVGTAAGVGVVAEVGVMYLYPRLAERISARQMLIWAFVGSAVRWVGMAAVSSALPIVLLSILHGLTFGAFYVAGISFVSRHVPEGFRARGQALFSSFTFGIGGLVGYLAAGAGYDWLGGHQLFAAAAGVELLAAVFIALTGRAPAPAIDASLDAAACADASPPPLP